MKDTICTGCSLVCDDVLVAVKKQKLESLGLCRLGHEYCAAAFGKSRLMRAMVRTGKSKQKAASMETALEQAVEILAKSHRPLLYGWSNSTNEVINLGLELARRLGGVFDSTASLEYGPLQEFKLVGGDADSVTLDDVRNNADHIVYWGVNPAESHHRHASRFSVFPKGEKIAEGRESRTVSVIDIRETESMRLANHQLIIKSQDGDEQFLAALLKELEGTTETPPEFIAGIPAIEFLSFVKGLNNADYIAIFYGNGLLHSTHAQKTLPLLKQVINRLNTKKRRCVTLPMITYCNTIGSIKTCRSATKQPFAIDFTGKSPKRYPSTTEGLISGDFDAALVFGIDAIGTLPGPAARSLQKLPIIASSSLKTLTTRDATVAIPTPIIGAECDGTVYRMDGTIIQLKPFKNKPEGIYSEKELLQQLLKRIPAS
jgi:formylmethanofuran dehydrogenase subunit B